MWCQTRVGSNAIFCGGCKRWVHKKCSGIKRPLHPDPVFRCARCLGTALAIAIDEKGDTEIEVGNKKLEAGVLLPSGHALCRRWLPAGWDHTLQMCMEQVPPIASPFHQPHSAPSDQRSSVLIMLQECDAACSRDLGHEGGYTEMLLRNDCAMICNVKTKEEVSSESLLTKLGMQDLDVVLRTRRMRWFGHVEHSTGCIAEECKLNVVAQKRPGRPRKTWDEVFLLTLRIVLSGKDAFEEAQLWVEENRTLKSI